MSNPPFDANSSDDESIDGRMNNDSNSDECETKQLYIANNQDKRLLVVLCIGLKDVKGDPIFDSSNEAWNAQPADVRKPLCSEHYIAAR